MLRSAALPTALALSFVLACSDDGNRETTAASGSQPTGVSTAPITAGGSTGDTAPTTSGTAGPGEPATSSTAGDATSTSDPSGVSGDAKFDLGASDLGGGNTTEAAGCKKVDFLFVIDNSTSMEDNQKALIASFPGFIAAIKNTLKEIDDYHIMVVDTDAGGRCAQPCDEADPDYTKFCSAANYYACNAMLDGCDVTFGAGVVHPVGSFASNKKCPVAPGHRYMLPDQADLEGTFACVATVGTAGSAAEKPMNAIQAALSYPLLVENGCNGGFLRDDAILVITFLSDDPNHPDKGTPEEWKASIVEAKNGDENAVVVLGLIPHPELGCALDGDTQGSHWQAFIELWGAHGLSGSICEPKYDAFFEQAIAAIDQTCEAFNPPG